MLLNKKFLLTAAASVIANINPASAQTFYQCIPNACSNGYYFNGTGCVKETSSPTCSAGQYLSNGTCTNCPAGTYGPAGSNTCIPCPAYSWSSAGASSCGQIKFKIYPCIASNFGKCETSNWVNAGTKNACSSSGCAIGTATNTLVRYSCDGGEVQPTISLDCPSLPCSFQSSDNSVEIRVSTSGSVTYCKRQNCVSSHQDWSDETSYTTFCDMYTSDKKETCSTLSGAVSW